MYHFGVLGKPSRERFNTVRQLESTGYFRVIIYSKAQDLWDAIQNKEVQGAVILIHQFKESHLKSITDLSKKLPNTPLLFAAPNIPGKFRKQLIEDNLYSAGVVDLSFELKDMNFILKAAVAGKKVPMRSARRFPIIRKATLKVKNGLPLEVELTNISEGGVQAVLKIGFLEKGTEISLTVPQEDGQGFHFVSGQVAWCNRVSKQVGIQFHHPMAQSGQLAA